MRRQHTKINQARGAQPLKADVGSFAAKAHFVRAADLRCVRTLLIMLPKFAAPAQLEIFPTHC